MVKRIPCRVISSAAFGKKSAGSSSSSRQHESSGVAAADAGFRHISNSESFNIGVGVVNGFAIGQILDCYA